MPSYHYAASIDGGRHTADGVFTSDTYVTTHEQYKEAKKVIAKVFEGDHFKHIAEKMIAEELPTIYETTLRDAMTAAARKKADRIAYRATKAIPEN